MPNELENMIADYQENVVQIPENVTEIERSAYCERSDIQYIRIPDTVTRIRDHAFAKSNIKNIAWPLNADEVSTSTFYGCTNLEWVNLPEGVTQIYDYAFLGCTKLLYIIIPPTVTYIGENVFANCEKLLEIYVPETLRDKGEEVFKCNTSAQIYYYKSIENLKKIVNDIREAKAKKRQELQKRRKSLRRGILTPNELRELRKYGVRFPNSEAISALGWPIENGFMRLFANSIPRSNPNISGGEITVNSKSESASVSKKCNRSFNGVIRKNLIAEKKKK